MLGFLTRMLITALGLWLAASLVPSIFFTTTTTLIIAALLLGAVNAVVRPIAIVLTLPVTILTLGLFVWVVNALMLMFAAAMVDGFKVEGFKSALWGSILLGVMNFLVGMMF